MQTLTLPDTPTARQMLSELHAEAEEQILAHRQATADALDKLRSDTDAIDKAASAIDKARAKVAKKNEEARAAVGELYRAQQVAQSLTTTRAKEVTKLERELQQTAPDDVQDLRGWLNDEYQRTRRLRPDTQYRTEKTWEGTRQVATHSTLASIERRLAYIVEMRNSLDELALLPDPADVRTACEEVRENLPTIEMEPIE